MGDVFYVDKAYRVYGIACQTKARTAYDFTCHPSTVKLCAALNVGETDR